MDMGGRCAKDERGRMMGTNITYCRECGKVKYTGGYVLTIDPAHWCRCSSATVDECKPIPGTGGTPFVHEYDPSRERVHIPNSVSVIPIIEDGNPAATTGDVPFNPTQLRQIEGLMRNVFAEEFAKVQREMARFVQIDLARQLRMQSGMERDA